MDNNLRLKISAFFLAILLWLYASGVEAPNILTWQASGWDASAATVPLRVKNLKETLKPPPLPEFVKVHYYGNNLPEKVLTQIEAYVDLEGLSEGQYWLNVCAELPKGLELALINPAMVLVTINEGLD